MYIVHLPDRNTAKLILYYVREGVKATRSQIEGPRLIELLEALVPSFFFEDRSKPIEPDTTDGFNLAEAEED